MNVIFLCKRQYTGKDVIDDEYGRLYRIPYELSKKGINVSCYSLSYQKKGYSRTTKAPNLDWTSIDFNLFHPQSLFRLKKEILDQIYKNTADIIITSSDVIHLGVAKYISNKTGLPLVTDLYDNYASFGLMKLPFMHSIYTSTLKHSSAVVCVSQPLANHIKQYCNDRCEVLTVENAVDHSIFKPLPMSISRKKLGLPDKVKLVGTAGALYNSRGIRTLFDAFRLILMENPDIHLVLAGRISGEVQLPVDKNVHYIGGLVHSDVSYFYNALDVAIICLTSSDFGDYCYPQKATEIIACKRPLVSSSVGVMKNLLKEYPQCLSDDGDAEMLARRIVEQLDNKTIPDIVVPSWAEQTNKIADMLVKVCTKQNSPENTEIRH